MTHQLTRDQARRIMVRAQLLDADRPSDVVEVAEQLGQIKIDPTNTIAPAEHTILWTRIGGGHVPGGLQRCTSSQTPEIDEPSGRARKPPSFIGRPNGLL